jgi:hypothetical protein
MNRGWLLVGAVSAAALVGTAIWVADAEDDAEEELATTDEGEPAPDRDRRPRGKRAKSSSAMARIEALEEQVASLEREVKALRAASGLTARLASSPSEDDEAVPDDPVLEGAVREIIENDRKEEREAEVERRRERYAEMIDESANELATAAGLNTEQRNNVAALWQSEAEQVMPLWMAARSEDRPWNEVRDEIEKIRASTDAEAKKLLGEEHHELYEEVRPRGRRDDRGRDRDRGSRQD